MVLRGLEYGLLAFATCSLAFMSVLAVQSAITATRRYSLFAEAVVIAGALFSFACCYQYVMAPWNAVWAGRFIGITSNSQHTAQFLSLFILPTAFSAVIRSRKDHVTIALWLLLLIEGGLLIYTGSRTGMLMTLTGILILMRRESRDLVVAIITIGALAFAMMQLLPESGHAAQRILTLEDTRLALFRDLWAKFWEHPFVGDMHFIDTPRGMRVAIRENSYLMIASMMGLVGITIFLIFLARVYEDTFVLWKIPRPNSKPWFGDLIIASIASILIGAATEGFLFAIVGPSYLLLYAYCGFAEDIAKSVRGASKAPAAQATIRKLQSAAQ
jgi:hypothetical protein